MPGVKQADARTWMMLVVGLIIVVRFAFLDRDPTLEWVAVLGILFGVSSVAALYQSSSKDDSDKDPKP